MNQKSGFLGILTHFNLMVFFLLGVFFIIGCNGSGGGGNNHTILSTSNDTIPAYETLEIPFTTDKAGDHAISLTNTGSDLSWSDLLKSPAKSGGDQFSGHHQTRW